MESLLGNFPDSSWLWFNGANWAYAWLYLIVERTFANQYTFEVWLNYRYLWNFFVLKQIEQDLRSRYLVGLPSAPHFSCLIFPTEQSSSLSEGSSSFREVPFSSKISTSISHSSVVTFNRPSLFRELPFNPSVHLIRVYVISRDLSHHYRSVPLLSWARVWGAPLNPCSSSLVLGTDTIFRILYAFMCLIFIIN